MKEKEKDMEKKEKDGQLKYDSKTIKKMNRRALLEVLVEQGKRIEELEATNATLKADLDRANMRLDNIHFNPEDVSAISKASSKIDGFFQVAQGAIEEYMSTANSNHVADVVKLYEKARKEYLRLLNSQRKGTDNNEEKTE